MPLSTFQLLGTITIIARCSVVTVSHNIIRAPPQKVYLRHLEYPQEVRPRKQT